MQPTFWCHTNAADLIKKFAHSFPRHLMWQVLLFVIESGSADVRSLVTWTDNRSYRSRSLADGVFTGSGVWSFFRTFGIRILFAVRILFEIRILARVWTLAAFLPVRPHCFSGSVPGPGLL